VVVRFVDIGGIVDHKILKGSNSYKNMKKHIIFKSSLNCANGLSYNIVNSCEAFIPSLTKQWQMLHNQ
jgi:hypothetical protein